MAWQELIDREVQLFFGGVGGVMYAAADGNATRNASVGLAAGIFVGASITPKTWSTSLTGEIRRTWSFLEDGDISGYGALVGIRVPLR